MVSPLPHRRKCQARCSHQKWGSLGAGPQTQKSARTLSLLVKGAGRVLVVLAAEVGGRWSDETADFLCQLAWAKVRELPEDLQRDGRRAWLRRWQKLLGCAAAKSFALSLLELATKWLRRRGPFGARGDL